MTSLTPNNILILGIILGALFAYSGMVAFSGGVFTGYILSKNLSEKEINPWLNRTKIFIQRFL